MSRNTSDTTSQQLEGSGRGGRRTALWAGFNDKSRCTRSGAHPLATDVVCQPATTGNTRKKQRHADRTAIARSSRRQFVSSVKAPAFPLSAPEMALELPAVFPYVADARADSQHVIDATLERIGHKCF